MCLEGSHCSDNAVVLWSPLLQSVCLLLQGNTYRTVCLLDFCSSIWFASYAIIIQCLNVLSVAFVATRYLAYPLDFF